MSLFKVSDLFVLIKEAIDEFELTNNDDIDICERYRFETKDVFENNKHYLDVIVYEIVQHYPPQISDYDDKFNNKLRITIEAL